VRVLRSDLSTAAAGPDGGEAGAAGQDSGDVTLADRLRWGEAEPKRTERPWWKDAKPLEPQVRINSTIYPHMLKYQ
jgi:hypothetical protein